MIRQDQMVCFNEGQNSEC